MASPGEANRTCIPPDQKSKQSREITIIGPMQEPLQKGKLSRVDLLLLASLDQLLLMIQTLFTFLKTSHLNEEVNGNICVMVLIKLDLLSVTTLFKKNPIARNNVYGFCLKC